MDSITKQYSSNIYQEIQEKPIQDCGTDSPWVDVEEDDFEELLDAYFEERLRAEEHGEIKNE